MSGSALKIWKEIEAAAPSHRLPILHKHGNACLGLRESTPQAAVLRLRESATVDARNRHMSDRSPIAERSPCLTALESRVLLVSWAQNLTEVGHRPGADSRLP